MGRAELSSWRGYWLGQGNTFFFLEELHSGLTDSFLKVLIGLFFAFEAPLLGRHECGGKPLCDPAANMACSERVRRSTSISNHSSSLNQQLCTVQVYFC